MTYWQVDLLLSYREGLLKILPGLHVSSSSGVLASLSLGVDHTMLLPGLGLGVGRMRLPLLSVQILLPGLRVRLVQLSRLCIVRIMMVMSQRLKAIIWILLFDLTITSNEVTITVAESKEAVCTVFYEHSIHAFGIFNDEIL